MYPNHSYGVMYTDLQSSEEFYLLKAFEIDFHFVYCMYRHNTSGCNIVRSCIMYTVIGKF